MRRVQQQLPRALRCGALPLARNLRLRLAQSRLVASTSSSNRVQVASQAADSEIKQSFASFAEVRVLQLQVVDPEAASSKSQRIRTVSEAEWNDPSKRVKLLQSLEAAGEPVFISRRAASALSQHLRLGSGSDAPAGSPAQQLLEAAAASTSTSSSPSSSSTSSATSSALATSEPDAALEAVLQQRSVPLSAAAGAITAELRKSRAATAAAPAPQYRKLTQHEARAIALAASGDTAALTELLAKHRDSGALEIDAQHGKHGGTALHVACAAGHIEIVKLLLDAGAQVNLGALNNSTPLHWAAGAGNLDVVKLLLDHGADPDVFSSTWGATVFGKGSGQTASHWAAESGHTHVISLLHAHSALSSVAPDERDQLPSDLSKKEGHSAASAALAKLQSEPYVCVQLKVTMRALQSLR